MTPEEARAIVQAILDDPDAQALFVRATIDEALRQLQAENARLRQAGALALAALDDVLPQARGALVREDIERAQRALRRVLPVPGEEPAHE